MSALTLRLREIPPARIDAGVLTPDRLRGLSADEVRSLPLSAGLQRLTVGDLFQVSGADPERLVVEECHERLDHLGRGMSHGHMTIEGNAGSYLANGLCGGRLEVRGNAGDFAATGMMGGEIRIQGDAGDFLGGALPGERRGMSGGVVVLTGNAGDRAGDRMRRGLMLIEGNAGSFCGARMLAGTLGVLGRTGEGLGFGLRRGTLLLAQAPASRPSLFNDCGTHPLLVLSLMLSSYRRVSDPFGALAERARAPVRRLAGDLGVDGRGEILLLDA